VSPIRRRVIAGLYLWEVHFIWNELVRDTRLSSRYDFLYRTYARWTSSRGREPVTPTVFASVLRREAKKMKDVSVVDGRWVRWKGIGVKLG
jgi:hypothetical protein